MRHPGRLKGCPYIITLFKRLHQIGVMIHNHLDQRRIAGVAGVDEMPRLIDAWTFALDAVGAVVAFEMQNILGRRKTAANP